MNSSALGFVGSVTDQEVRLVRKICGLALTVFLLACVTIGWTRNRALVPGPKPAANPETILFTTSQIWCGAGKMPCFTTQNIWTISADGSDARQLTRITRKANVCSAPTWSPNGSTIVFGCTADPSGRGASDNTLHFWTMNAGGSNLKPLPGIWDPVWSPDNRRLAFISNRSLHDRENQSKSTSGNVWMMNADGSGAVPLTRLTSNMVSARGVIWSPDGSKVAFLSNRALDGSNRKNGTEGIFNIWVVHLGHSKAIPLTKFTAVGINVLSVEWSPDGKELAFLSNCAHDGSDVRAADTSTNIWMTKTDGSGIHALTKLQHATIGDFNWSPDGSRLVFSSNGVLDGSDLAERPFTRNIWMLNAEGSGAFPLTRSAEWGYDNTNALWSPDSKTICFTSTRPLGGSKRHVGNIWVMKADGSSPVALTHFTDRGAVATAWHP